MMKMNLSLIKNAGSAFFFLLFLCMGSFATAQTISTSPNSGVAVSVLKGYDNFVTKSQALNIVAQELDALVANSPAGGQAEATHAVKKAFLIKAGNVLKMNGSVMDALNAGNTAAIARKQTFSNVSINTNSILLYFADIVSL